MDLEESNKTCINIRVGFNTVDVANLYDGTGTSGEFIVSIRVFGDYRCSSIIQRVIYFMYWYNLRLDTLYLNIYNNHYDTQR